MKAEEIINKAALERQKWHRKGYRNGKFIIGIDIENKLLASAEHSMNGTIEKDTLMGFDYVVDYQNPNDIQFCPIED